MRNFFRPELIGRFEEKIVFKPLSTETQREIGHPAVSQELDRFKQYGFDLAAYSIEDFWFAQRNVSVTLMRAAPVIADNKFYYCILTGTSEKPLRSMC